MVKSVLERLPPKGLGPETKLVVGLVSGSHFINHMYLVLLPPIFAILVTDFGVSLTQLGFAVGVMGLFGMIFQLPFGYLSDNYGRTITLGIGLSMGALGVFVLALAPVFEWILVGQAMLGIGIAAHHPAHFPLLSDASTEQNLGRVFSVHGFAGNLGYAASPAIITGVLALPGTTWRHAFGLIGIVGGGYALLSIWVLSRSVSDEVTNPVTDQSTDDEYALSSVGERIASEIKSLFTSPAILALALLSLITAMANWGIRSYSVVLLTDGYDVPLSTANGILTVMFVAAATLILVGGELSDRFSAKLVLFASYATVAITAGAVSSLVLPTELAMVCVVLTGGTLLMGGPAKSKLVDRLSMRGDLGKNFAIITVGVQFGGTAAPPLFGAIIDTTGLELAFITIAGFAVLGGVVVAAILHSYRDVLASGPTAQASDD